MHKVLDHQGAGMPVPASEALFTVEQLPCLLITFSGCSPHSASGLPMTQGLAHIGDLEDDPEEGTVRVSLVLASRDRHRCRLGLMSDRHAWSLSSDCPCLAVGIRTKISSPQKSLQNGEDAGLHTCGSNGDPRACRYIHIQII